MVPTYVPAGAIPEMVIERYRRTVPLPVPDATKDEALGVIAPEGLITIFEKDDCIS